MKVPVPPVNCCVILAASVTLGEAEERTLELEALTLVEAPPFRVYSSCATRLLSAVVPLFCLPAAALFLLAARSYHDDERYALKLNSAPALATP